MTVEPVQEPNTEPKIEEIPTEENPTEENNEVLMKL